MSDTLRERIEKWLFSTKWTDTHTEFDEISAIEQFVLGEIAKARLDEATNWHQYGAGHDDDGWCCQRETELRDELYGRGVE